jgi:hypothetical protein
MLDTRLYTLLAELPPSSLVFALVLAVALAPVVYRFRLRLRRWLVRLAWFSAGLALGIIISS